VQETAAVPFEREDMMERSIQTIPGREYTGRITRRSAARRGFPLRPWFRALAAWWADDSMYARFEQQRARDDQLLLRHAR
jgi:hypothetical protein